MFFLVFLLFLNFFLKLKHLLSFLIGLEFINLFIFFGLSLIFLTWSGGIWLLLSFLAIAGCESAVGLFFFVSYVFSYSKDYFLSLGLMEF